MRILHVTETYVRSGAGRVIDQIAAACPEFQHHLLYVGDPGHPDEAPRGFASAEELPGGLGQRLLATQQHIRKLGPDIVHAHSSWAGVYVRAYPVAPPVIYQPHCFKFDDPYVAWPVREIYRNAERALLPRTACTAVLSPHEEGLVHGLDSRAKTTFIPNVPLVAYPARPPATEPQPDEDVAMIGRLCRQKDPIYFAEVAEALRTIRPGTRMRWIGDGEPDYHARLAAAGITITGWVSGPQLDTELNRPAVYLHSAAYEGFPLSVLDAAVSGRPVLVRDIPPFEGTPLATVGDPHSAAVAVAEVLDGGPLRGEVVVGTEKLAAMMTRQAQHEALVRMYESIGGCATLSA